MEWFIGITLYLAAGGVFTVLFHLFSCIARTYDKKYPDPLTEKKSFLWRLFDFFYGIVMILSFFLILPYICIFFDSRLSSDAVNKEYQSNRQFSHILFRELEEKDTRIKELEKALDDEIFRSAQLQKSFDHPAE